jgi:hypothetical protein
MRGEFTRAWGLVRALKFGDIAGPGAKVGNAPHREIRNA